MRRNRPPEAMIGGETIPVKPMALEATLRFLLVVAPYAALLERYKFGLDAALGEKDPLFIQSVVSRMASRMRDAPGDIVRAVALLLDRDPEWVAHHALAEEIVAALPLFDRVNDFATLFRALDVLGIPLPVAEEGG